MRGQGGREEACILLLQRDAYIYTCMRNKKVYKSTSRLSMLASNDIGSSSSTAQSFLAHKLQSNNNPQIQKAQRERDEKEEKEKKEQQQAIKGRV